MSREAFEKGALSMGYCLNRSTDNYGKYEDNWLQESWEVYQACESHMQAELDRLKAEKEKLISQIKQVEQNYYCLYQDMRDLVAKYAELKDQCPPVENGRNRYGLDVSYFRQLINRELNRSLTDFKPEKLARVFARASVTADKSVIFEDEFQALNPLKENGK